MTDIPDTPDGTSGDFLTVLSSELIAEVMEEYFNKKMYRQKVKVVDLQPQGSGYAFSLAFVKDDPKLLHITPVDVDINNNIIAAQEIASLNSHVQEVLEKAANVDYTVPQQCPHGVYYNPRRGDSCPQCYHDHMVVTGVITPRDTKGKFTKKAKG